MSASDHSHDVIVAGLGAMGSAIAMHLARRGLSVAAFDRHRPPHAFGSSHGGSRIIREAYFEHPAYVPIVHRAYELWNAIERDTGTKLYVPTGGLMIGEPGSELVTGAIASARRHGLEHAVLDADSVRSRFPQLRIEPDMVAVHEPRAGVLFPERCVEAQLALAAGAGADLRCDEPVVGWHSDGDGVRVVTNSGEHRARRLVVAAGAWTAELLPTLREPLGVERQVLYWFRPRGEGASFAPQRCPIHLWQFDDGQFFYGFPDMGEGVKVARHHRGAATTPYAVERTVSAVEIDDIAMLVRRFVPDAEGDLVSTAVCLYTNTPDGHFRIGWLDRAGDGATARDAGDSGVLVVSACSGHGFKFAPAIGEIAADLVTGRPPRFDLSLFRLQ